MNRSAKSYCSHGRVKDWCTECRCVSALEEQQSINAMLRKELAIYKERSDVMHGLVMFAYQKSSDALMMPPSKPREARAAREQAICDINKKLGGHIR